MTLPSEPYFTVTYKLIPESGTNPAAMKITGMFSYMINDRTFTSPIVERRETLAGLSRNQLNNILRDIDMKVEDPPALATTTQPGQSTRPPETTTPPRTTTPTTPTTPVRRPDTGSSSNAKYLLTFEQGIRFRIQIAAGHKEVNIQRYFNNYRLEHKVLLDKHEGWNKYLVGSFAEYKDARDYRVHLRNTTPIKDAFVAAYNDSKRITVQEALMASNQKWVQ